MRASRLPGSKVSTRLCGMAWSWTKKRVRAAASMPTTPPVVEPDDGMDGNGEMPMADPTAGLFATAQNARDDSGAAAEAATEAVKTAMEASGKLGTLKVNGESMIATANAQAVLDAQAAAMSAVTNAEAAQKSAEDALVEAMALPADNENRDSLIAALEAAIEAAKMDVATAKTAAEGMDLKTAVEMVTGSDPEVEGYPTMPDSYGEDVAADIGSAIMAAGANDNGRGTRAPHSNAAPTGDAAMNAVMMNDHRGMTWADIVGDDALTDMRIADGTTGNSRAVKAASFAGMALTSITGAAPSATDTIANGAQYVGNYKGIEGVVFCAGSDCKVEGPADSEKLTGSWYFTTNANNEKTYYEKVGTAETYTADTAYAQFGHWLTANNDGQAVVNTYARTGHSGTPNWTTVNETGETLTNKSAKYSGSAAGMSVTTGADGTATASGAFTADVNLTATFHATAPMLGGTVNNFQGDAVGSGWSVTLENTAVNGGNVAEGRAIASGRDGEWSATSYGNNDARPTGIFGGFNAYFSDGSAAGAYATRKD